MRILKVVFLISSLVCWFPAFSQKNILQPIVRGAISGVETLPVRSVQLPFEQALRAGGLAYMVPNSRVGTEALNAGIKSSIGKEQSTLASNLKCKAYELCARHLKSHQLETLVERQVLQAPFPGYYVDFADAWEAFASRGGKLGTLEVILEAAYGPEAQFKGSFLSTYGEVVQLSKTWFEATSRCGEALAWAYSQGMKKEHGFFVIQVQATKEHSQDVLLLNLKDSQNIQFISLRQSLGGEWMDTYWVAHE